MYSTSNYQLAREVHKDALSAADKHRLIRSLPKDAAHRSIFSWIESVAQKFQQAAGLLRSERRKRQSNSIIRSATDTFVQMHPEMTRECFDTHFLTHRAESLLTTIIEGQQPYSARALADLWAAQFGVSQSAHTRLSGSATHMAAEFLYVLESTVKSNEPQTNEQAAGFQNAQFAS